MKTCFLGTLCILPSSNLQSHWNVSTRLEMGRKTPEMSQFSNLFWKQLFSELYFKIIILMIHLLRDLECSYNPTSTDANRFTKEHTVQMCLIKVLKYFMKTLYN